MSYVRTCASSRTSRGQRETCAAAAASTTPYRGPRACAHGPRARPRAYVSICQTPDTGFGQRVRPAEALGRQGTASWPVVPSLTPPYLFFYYFLPSWVSRCLTSLVRVFQLWLQDRAGEPADRSRDMLKLVCGHAGRAWPALARGGVKDRNVRASGQTGSVSAAALIRLKK